MLKEIRRGIHDTSEDELIFILGDVNAHLGIIGDQDVNYNGRIVLDILTYLLTYPLHPNVGHKATMSLLHR